MAEYVEYTWDHRNRLTRVLVRDKAGDPIKKEAAYTYDVFDRRLTKTVDPDGAGTMHQPVTTRFVSDGPHVALVFEGASNTATLTHRYLHGPMIDEILADEQGAGGALLWPLTDHLGTVRDLATASGVIPEGNHIKYDSFGKIVAPAAPPAALYFAFTGREWDRELDQYYYRGRYYDPQTGTFLSEDPISFDGGDPNLYRYVGNGPTSATDPTGLEPIPLDHPLVVAAQQTAEDARRAQRIQLHKEILDLKGLIKFNNYLIDSRLRVLNTPGAKVHRKGRPLSREEVWQDIEAMRIEIVKAEQRLDQAEKELNFLTIETPADVGRLADRFRKELRLEREQREQDQARMAREAHEAERKRIDDEIALGLIPFRNNILGLQEGYNRGHVGMMAFYLFGLFFEGGTWFLGPEAGAARAEGGMIRAGGGSMALGALERQGFSRGGFRVIPQEVLAQRGLHPHHFVDDTGRLVTPGAASIEASGARLESALQSFQAVTGFRPSEVLRATHVDLLSPPHTWPKPGPDSRFQIYILVDAESQQLLKVGYANNFWDRLQGPGNRPRARLENKRVEAFILEFGPESNALTIEKNARNLLLRRGHQLPWDESHLKGHRSGTVDPSQRPERP